MPAERIDEVLLQKYLLGNLSEQERVRVEDRAFADPAYLGALEAAEADLIDAYVRGELSQADRRQFERLFLTSRQRRNKVEFARALATVAAESKPLQFAVQERQSVWQAFLNLLHASDPALRFAAGMVALAVVAGASWLAVQNIGMRSRVAALEAQGREMRLHEQAVRQQLSEEQARAANLAAQSQKPSAGNGRPQLLASLVFLPGLSRAGTSVQQLALNSMAQLAHIEIRLEPRDEYPRYRVELHTGGGDDVLARSNLTRRRTSSGYGVSFDIPSSAIPAGDYELALKGVAEGHTTDIGYYYFRVLKQ
jgi:anti-sigma factor RsiW